MTTDRHRRIVMMVVALLLVTATAQAQGWLPNIYYSNQNQVIMNMDLPANASLELPEYQPVQGAWVFSTGLYFAGWAFNCNGTPPVLSLQEWDVATNTFVDIPAVITTGIHRPDVAAAFAAWPCTVSAYSGWHAHTTTPLSPGIHYILVKGYAPGGTYVPGTGMIQPAGGYAQRFVVVMQ